MGTQSTWESVNWMLNMRVAFILLISLLGFIHSAPFPQNGRRRTGQGRNRNRMRQRENRQRIEASDQGLYGVSRDSLEWDEDSYPAVPTENVEEEYNSTPVETTAPVDTNNVINVENLEQPADEIADTEGCGPDCRNLLHEVEHPKEEERCPQGMVLDIYGYCRYIFQEERRDWAWWESVRNHVRSYK